MTHIMQNLPLAVWDSPIHWILLALLVLLLFGGKKLPELARGLGRGMRIFKDELHGVQKDIDEPAQPADKHDDKTPPKA